MVLAPRTPSAHNAMLGSWLTKTKTPAATPSKTAKTPSIERPAKRPKLSNKHKSHAVEDEDQNEHQSDHEYTPRPSTPTRRIIPDSDADSGDEEVDGGDDEPSSTQRTDIEQSLPQIKTDRHAIEEYETLRAAEGTNGLSTELKERLGQREWVKGKSSIYVDAFNLALETVLEDESHLFDEKEMKVFAEWRGLGYEAQYL